MEIFAITIIGFLVYFALTSLFFWQILAVGVLAMLWIVSPEIRVLAWLFVGLFVLAVFGGLG